MEELIRLNNDYIIMKEDKEKLRKELNNLTTIYKKKNSELNLINKFEKKQKEMNDTIKAFAKLRKTNVIMSPPNLVHSCENVKSQT